MLDVSFDEFLEFNPILADTLDVEKCRSWWSSRPQKMWRFLRAQGHDVVRLEEVEVKEEIQEEVKDEITEEVKDDIKEEVKDDVKDEVKPEHHGVKCEFQQGVKDDVKEDFRHEEVKHEVKHEVKPEIKHEDKHEVKREVKHELKVEMKETCELEQNFGCAFRIQALRMSKVRRETDIHVPTSYEARVPLLDQAMCRLPGCQADLGASKAVLFAKLLH